MTDRHSNLSVALPASLSRHYPLPSAASNYNSAFNIDDGSCRYHVYGCTVVDALNYDPLSTVSVGCSFAVAGCLDSYANNFAPDANTDSEQVLHAINEHGGITYYLLLTILISYDVLLTTYYLLLTTYYVYVLLETYYLLFTTYY